MRLRLALQLGTLALLPVGLSAQAPLPLKYAPKTTVAAITAADLMSRLYLFADDSMQGRETGSPGAIKATAYLAAEAKRLGLLPAGDSGTYFQTVSLIARTLSATGSITANTTPLAAFADFVALPFRGAYPRKLDGVTAVYGGIYGDTAHAITAEQAAGKLVVLQAPNGLGRLAPTSPLLQAAAIAIISGDRLTPDQLRQAHAPSMTLMPAPDAPAVAVTLLVTGSAARALLGGDASGMTVGTTGAVVHGNLTYDESPAPSRNVIAILPGTDPRLKGEYVAIGAHSDHVGYRILGAVNHDSTHLANTQRYFITDNRSGATLTGEQQAERVAKLREIHIDVDSLARVRPARPDSINNGADDDGSGTVTLLEVAEAFAKGSVKPKRSVLFVWHSAEEKGLLGSKHFSEHPTVPWDSIVAQINLDQVGRGSARDLPGGSEDLLMLVGSRRLSTELGDLVETVNRAAPKPFTLDYTYDADGHPENVYCRSDHFNYARFGIPIVFLTTGLHGDYHQVTDEPQYIDYPHLTRITQLVFNLVNRVAGLDHRPLVDKPKPDPLGVCRQ